MKRNVCGNHKTKSNGPRSLQRLQSIADQLRKDLNTSRVTIRVDSVALCLALEAVAVESLADGVKAIKSETTPDIRNGNAPKWLIANRRTFVMQDCLHPSHPELAPESYVIETYAVRAEMVSPVLKSCELVGIISAHHTVGPRQWTPQEVSRIEAACKHVADVLVASDATY